jgi:hypothetical protein
MKTFIASVLARLRAGTISPRDAERLIAWAMAD